MPLVDRVKAQRHQRRDNVPAPPGDCLYDGMDSAVVDLYGLRCAVACLVHARDNISDLTTAHLIRFDAAVRLLTRSRKSLDGPIGANTERLLSRSEDRYGDRTMTAIERLAKLTQVTTEAAPALAASLPSCPTQGKLFD